jgi:hypothetical protein
MPLNICLSNRRFFTYSFQSSLFFLLCMGLLLNYSIFLCTETNSPLTTTSALLASRLPLLVSVH